MILEMENRGELLNALRQRAAQRIRENYTWEKIVAPYSLLFENMVK
jgi:glycosyltransferase involved in cell wall biosynthesis